MPISNKRNCKAVKKMNVVIRTDASVEIGSGHVMRCLTLAKQLKRHNINVTFICREFEGNYIHFLKGSGFDVINLPLLNDNRSIDALKNDACETIKRVKEIDSVDLLIVDHYSLDENWEKALRPYVKKVMVIDDLANRKHDCDLLLDQNYYENLHTRYEQLVPAHCTMLLGPKYVLLRDEFFNVHPRVRDGSIEQILIFFGSSDPTGETIKALRAIEQLNDDRLKVDVIVGASNPRCEEIEKMCQNMSSVTFHFQVNNMAMLIQRADLAIGAGGAITWERAVLGLPTLTVTIAENQLETTKLLHHIGATIYVGKSENISVAMLTQNIEQLLNDKQLMKQLSKRSEQIVNIDDVKKYPVVKAILTMIGDS